LPARRHLQAEADIKVTYPPPQRRCSSMPMTDSATANLSRHGRACAIARHTASGMGAVINSTHFGAAGAYALAAPMPASSAS